jgi:hypothetical protein
VCVFGNPKTPSNASAGVRRLGFAALAAGRIRGLGRRKTAGRHRIT